MLTPLRSRVSLRSILRGAALALAIVSVGTACSDDKDADDGDDGGEGDLCGGIIGARCGDDFFCDYPESSACGIADGGGTCQPRPTVCVPVIDEVCGCDGERYSSPCDAQREGVDISASDDC